MKENPKSAPEKLIVELEFNTYTHLKSNGDLNGWLAKEGFDLKFPMKWESDPRTGNITFVQ